MTSSHQKVLLLRLYWGDHLWRPCIWPITVTVWPASLNHFHHLIDVSPVWKKSSTIAAKAINNNNKGSPGGKLWGEGDDRFGPKLWGFMNGRKSFSFGPSKFGSAAWPPAPGGTTPGSSCEGSISGWVGVVEVGVPGVPGWVPCPGLGAVGRDRGGTAKEKKLVHLPVQVGLL